MAVLSRQHQITGSSRLPPYDDSLFERIATGLETQGYVILPAALPPAIADGLVEALSRLDGEQFHPASIGRRQEQGRNQFVRRDQIAWIDDSLALAHPWLDWTGRLKSFLNRRLFLGLFSFESHFALYQPGDFYKKHLDAFRGESNRVLSMVTYLNKGWEPDHGGELVLYPSERAAEAIRITPGFGTLVLFLSEEFPHEVLPAERERYSVAGWFRVNTSINNQVDPPL